MAKPRGVTERAVEEQRRKAAALEAVERAARQLESPPEPPPVPEPAPLTMAQRARRHGRWWSQVRASGGYRPPEVEGYYRD